MKFGSIGANISQEVVSHNSIKLVISGNLTKWFFRREVQALFLYISVRRNQVLYVISFHRTLFECRANSS